MAKLNVLRCGYSPARRSSAHGEPLIMAAFDLPPGPRELLARTRTILAASVGGESHLVLGGGTALIARWHHRWTHDLDFFIEAGPYACLYQNAIAFERDIRAVGAIRSLKVRPHTAVVIFQDGTEISIGTTPPFTDNPRSTDTVRGTAVALETSAEILAKKLGGRILRNNIFVPRDLYDLVIAWRSEPDSLSAALRCFTPDLLQQIADELRHLPLDWMDTHPVPVVAPSDPDAARRSPKAVWTMVQQRRWPR